jgi:hypothetical protein
MPRSLPALVVLLAACLVAPPAPAQSVKRGKWRINDEPKGWILYSTKHYQVQSQIPKERAKLVSDHLERVMVEYRKRFPIRKPLKDMVLKIFADRPSYLKYGSPLGSVAYYSQGDRELVCYDTGFVTGNEIPPEIEKERLLFERLKKLGVPESEMNVTPKLLEALQRLSNMNLLGVLSHEGWHQYFHFYIVSQVDFPSWLDEGMGDYFYTTRPAPDGGSMVFGDLMPIRFAIIWGALKTERTVPVKEFVRYRQREYYKDASLSYAQGWSLVYFCYHSGNETYAKIPGTLIRVFKDKHDMDEATDAAFARIDMEKFEEEWKAFFLGRDFSTTMIEMARALEKTTPSSVR